MRFNWKLCFEQTVVHLCCGEEYNEDDYTTYANYKRCRKHATYYQTKLINFYYVADIVYVIYIVIEEAF